MRYERGYGADGGLGDRPTGDLLRELVRDGQVLLREEVRLAKAEIRAEAKRAARGGAEVGAGGAVLYAALLGAGATLALLLSRALPGWAAALIVTAAYGVAGWLLVGRGRRDLARTEPSRAIQNLKEDGRWARETMRDVRSRRHADA